MSLFVPCQLGEVELALAMEMFITVNASAICSSTELSDASLTITLKRYFAATNWISWFVFHNPGFPSSSRTQSTESEYLSASSRLLSASSVLLPKPLVQYKAVNPSQDQVFTVCPASARSWLYHNHRWANEAWANWSPHQSALRRKHEAVASRGEKLIKSSWRRRKCFVCVGMLLKVSDLEENHMQNAHAVKASWKKILNFLFKIYNYFNSSGVSCSINFPFLQV